MAVLRQCDERMQKQIACMMWLQLGDKERMYALMEKYVREVFFYVAFFDEIRNEPRFIGLEQRQRRLAKR